MTQAGADSLKATSWKGSFPAWLLFVVVSVVEYLAVSFAVDAKDLVGPAGLDGLLGSIGTIAPLAVVFLGAVVVTGGTTIRLRLRQLSSFRPERPGRIAWGITHLLVAAVVAVLTQRIRSAAGEAEELMRTYLALWLALVLCATGTLALALWTRAMLLNALRGLRRELGLGVAVAIVAWAAGLLAQWIWAPLARLTLEFSHAVLTLLTSDPVASVERSIVGTSRFYVEISPVCSGIEGIGLMLTFVGAFLYLERRELRWPWALLLVPVSAVCVWLLNVVRVVGLIAVGTWYSPEVALGGFHSKAGWLLFTVASLGMVLLVQRGTLLRRLPEESGGAPNELAATSTSESVHQRTTEATSAPAGGHESSASETAAYLAPLLAVLATKLVTGLATTGFDFAYPLSVLAAALALWAFRRHYFPVDFTRPWWSLMVGLGVAAVWILGFDAGHGSSSLPEALASLPRPLAILWLLLRFLGTTLTIPVVEELAFRGYLLRRFVSPNFTAVPYGHLSWLGLIVSSAGFGLLHSQMVLGVISGFAFGLLAVTRGRLTDAILAHAVANAVIALYAVMTGDWMLLG